MFDWIRQRVLHFLRVPHDPAPPFGAPGSVRIFRAARNYYNLRLVRWGFGQVGALMRGAAALAVPLTVDAGTGRNWDEAH